MADLERNKRISETAKKISEITIEEAHGDVKEALDCIADVKNILYTKALNYSLTSISNFMNNYCKVNNDCLNCYLFFSTDGCLLNKAKKDIEEQINSYTSV